VSAAVLERLRERRRQVARRLPVVITTRRRSQASHAETLQLGMDYASFIIRRDVEAAAAKCYGLASGPRIPTA
jgi:hypothetical protein